MSILQQLRAHFFVYSLAITVAGSIRTGTRKNAQPPSVKIVEECSQTIPLILL
jgi:hypothetical protein